MVAEMTGMPEQGPGQGPQRLHRCLAAALIGLATTAMGAIAVDEVPSPPASEEIASPSGSYVLELSAPFDWQTGSPEGALYALTGDSRHLLWQRALPHQWRARFALVSDGGRVLLLDDWWNIPSARAVMVLGRDGAVVAVRGFEEVRAALGVPTPALVEQARHGPWIAGPPRIAAGSEAVRVPAAGKLLVVDLADGSLSSEAE